MIGHLLLAYVLFLAKIITVVIASVVILMSFFAFGHKPSEEGTLELKELNEKFQRYRRQLQEHFLSAKEIKALLKEESQATKKAKIAAVATDTDAKRVFVLGFDGDLKASAVAALREEITAILQVARPTVDTVVLCLESPGGVVHGYGLAASQLGRLRAAKITLEVCVDKVAASGGYLMAALADRIIAAPFAVVGSIGVVAQLPNFNRLLKKHDIDIELHTAGAYKRTLTVLGENTEEGRLKFKEELEETHILFKNWVQEARPGLNMERVATGEHWYGQTALTLGLIDEIATSDDYLGRLAQEAKLFAVSFTRPKSLIQKISNSFIQSTEDLLLRLFRLVRFVP